MFETILEILKNLGLPGLFAGMYFEAFGLPFPGTLLVAFAGFLAKQGHSNIFLTWFVAMAGFITGSVSAFLIGRHVGEPFFRRWGRYLHLTSERFDTAQEWFQKSAPGFIIGGRFIPTVGNITPYMAGISNISLLRYLLYDFVHATIWVTMFLGAGWLLGRNWYLITEKQWFKWFWLFGIIIIIFFLAKHLYVARSKIKS
ncbi:DedA family protein [Desulforamulus aquiferis]|uniref:DedA family protein n=1 Tax=Desulforamulus aquiferis TaxID=1397668 RepID=A0AAW7ZII7_9FIRM|nr:DedA family protein [Desulforamulus aquiferis]MDO7788490.1 DedA family protein [Desulforamulus aquiferis]RYD01893.1 hypothetical protein N752_27600 [Desulforamulus aquiferis]